MWCRAQHRPHDGQQQQAMPGHACVSLYMPRKGVALFDTGLACPKRLGGSVQMHVHGGQRPGAHTKHAQCLVCFSFGRGVCMHKHLLLWPLCDLFDKRPVGARVAAIGVRCQVAAIFCACLTSLPHIRAVTCMHSTTCSLSCSACALVHSKVSGCGMLRAPLLSYVLAVLPLPPSQQFQWSQIETAHDL